MKEENATSIEYFRDFRRIADLINGAIVGSYFIRLLEEQGFAPEAAETYCRTFKKELNA